MNRSKSLASKKASLSNDNKKPIAAKKMKASTDIGFDFMPSHTNDLDAIIAKEHAQEVKQKERELAVKNAKNLK